MYIYNVALAILYFVALRPVGRYVATAAVL